MLSTQTTETIEPLQISESPLIDLGSPMCKGAPIPTPTPGDPFLTTFASAISTTVGGITEVVCEGAVNCTDINDQRGATIASPILLGLTGTVGQIWALVYLHCSTKRHNQRTVFYLLLCILIWTDFFGKVLTTPPAIISYSNRSWVGGKPMCDFHGFSMVFISTLTHFTVSAMAVERYLGICHGYFYSRNVTPSRCKMIFFGMWVFCFLLSVLPLFNVGEFYLQYPGTWCFTNFHLCKETPVLQKIFTTGLGVLNVSNILVIVVCNVFVVGSLLKMRITPHLAFQQGQPHRNRKKNEQELQMVIVLVVITCIFVVSWAPLDIILVTNQAWPPHTPEDHFHELVAVRLCSLNQIVDPFAYIISRVIFRSRFWSCCRRAIMGRGWSRRGEGASHFQISTLLHARKFSRAQSPPKDHRVAVKEVNPGIPEEAATRPETEKTTRAPSIHKSYYSDSGTGSYSGVDTPLVDKVEEPPFSPGDLREGKGTALQQSLVKSLSVAIPIPLFTSEQYRVAELGKEEEGQGRDIYCLLDSGHRPVRHRVSNPENRGYFTSSANEYSTDFSVVTLSGGYEDPGIYRSNSWSCQGMRPPQAQLRMQSTQTLTVSPSNYPDSQLVPTEAPLDNQRDREEPNGNLPDPRTDGRSLNPAEMNVEKNGNVEGAGAVANCPKGPLTLLEAGNVEATSQTSFISTKRPHSPSPPGNDPLKSCPLYPMEQSSPSQSGTDPVEDPPLERTRDTLGS